MEVVAFESHKKIIYLSPWLTTEEEGVGEA